MAPKRLAIIYTLSRIHAYVLVLSSVPFDMIFVVQAHVNVHSLLSLASLLIRSANCVDVYSNLVAWASLSLPSLSFRVAYIIDYNLCLHGASLSLLI